MNWFRRGVKVGNVVGLVANMLPANEDYSHDIYFILLGRRNPSIVVMTERQFKRISDAEYEELTK